MCELNREQTRRLLYIFLYRLVIRKRYHKAAETDTSCGESNWQESKVDPTRYVPSKVQKEPTTEAKRLKSQQQQKPSGNQRRAKVDPKVHYDTPRAQRQVAAAAPVGRKGPQVSTVSKGIEMSQEKDVYEAMDPEIYEETF